MNAIETRSFKDICTRICKLSNEDIWDAMLGVSDEFSLSENDSVICASILGTIMQLKDEMRLTEVTEGYVPRIADKMETLEKLKSVSGSGKFNTLLLKELIELLKYVDRAQMAVCLIKQRSTKASETIHGGTKTYIIQNKITKAIKIGKSAKPGDRINTIKYQVGADMDTLAVIEGDIELHLHSKFKELRTVGEWFMDRDGEIIDYIQKRLFA